MKKVTAREFARNQRRAISSLKGHEVLVVTKHGKALFVVSKPEPPPSRRVRARDLLRDLKRLPMTEAEGEEILKKFASETLF